MANLLSDSLFLPALTLAVLALAIPNLLALILPEGVKPLLLNAFLSTFLLFLISASFFVCLYIWQGAPLSGLSDIGWSANLVFFGRLGVVSAIIWGPIMLLSVAGLPRKWVKETW